MKSFLSLLACMAMFCLQAQITVQDSVLPYDLVTQHFLTNGIFISNATVNGDAQFSSTQLGSFEDVSEGIGLPQGIVLTTGSADGAAGPNDQGGFTGLPGAGSGNDFDLQVVMGFSSPNDECILEFDFVATADSMNFTYVFGSEEYPEFVNSFNDGFGFFINGPGIEGPFSNNGMNIALIPGTDMPVSIDNLNNGNDGINGPCANCEYYIDNQSGSDVNLPQYDGFSVPMVASIGGLQIGETYHIKLAIADAMDSAFDSGVFLKDQSFELICTDDGENLQGDGSFPCALCTTDFEITSATCNGEITLVDLSVILIPWDSAEFVVNGQSYDATAPEVVVSDLPPGTHEVVLNVYAGDFVSTVSQEVNIAYDELESFAALDLVPSSEVCTGSATIELVEDEALFLFSWDDGAYTGFNSAENLCAGPHDVKVWSEELCEFGNFEFTIEATFGMDEASELRINIFPNPAAEVLTIDGLSLEPNSSFLIYDMSGRIVLSKSLTDKFIDVSALSAGNYTLEVNQGGQLVRQSFIKE